MSKLKAKDPKAAEPSKPKILIYGKPGVGKTWQALDFPACYYIDTEGGADLAHYTDKLKAAGGMYMGPEDGSLDFGVVIEQLQALATEKHSFRTVIVDSITKLFNTAVAIEAERLGAKNAFGADKKPAITFMRRLVTWADRLDMNVIFIAHSKVEWGTDPKSGERVEIGQTFDCWDKLEYELHLCLEILKNGPSRRARVRKSRLTGFPDAETFSWSYDEFAARYGKDIIEGTVKQIQLATPEQVAEINKLRGAVKLADGEFEAKLEKAGAATVEELTAQHAESAIKFLRSKVS
jgi:hypothetical protein